MVEHQILKQVIIILQKEKHPLSNRRLWELLKAECRELEIELELGQQKLNPLKLQKFLSKFTTFSSILTEPRNGVFFIKPELNSDDHLAEIEEKISAFIKAEITDKTAQPVEVEQAIEQDIDIDEEITILDDNEKIEEESSLNDLDVSIEEFGSRFQSNQSDDHYEPLKLLSLINAKSLMPVKIEAVADLIKKNPLYAEWLWSEIQNTYQKALKEFNVSPQGTLTEIKYLDQIENNAVKSNFPPPSMSAQINRILKSSHQKNVAIAQSPKKQENKEVDLSHSPTIVVDNEINITTENTPQNLSDIHLFRKKKKAQFKGEIDLKLYEDQEIDPEKVSNMLACLRNYTEAEFEALVIEYLKKLEYYEIQKIHQQKGGRIAIYAISPRQQATLILAQLKSNTIDQKTIHLLLEHLQHFNAQHGMMISTGEVIKDGMAQLGGKGKITLLDGNSFIQSLIKNEILVKEITKD